MDIPRSLFRPAIGLTSAEIEDKSHKIGASRLGGQPDVPESFNWPYRAEKPLAFLAQLNLADFAHLDCGLDLPKSGTLLFFYDAESQPWGYDPKHAGSGQIFFCENSANLVRVDFPSDLSEQCRFPICGLAAQQIDTRPNAWSVWVDLLKPTADERFEMAEDNEEEWYDHQIGGHASCVQHAMELECELASSGVYCGGSKGYHSERRRHLTEAGGARDWRLLLQLTSDPQCNFIWGDDGYLYFWIRQQDLAARDFSRIWTILQCT